MDNLVLEVLLDGIIQAREFDPEEEAIDAIGQALISSSAIPAASSPSSSRRRCSRGPRSPPLIELLDGPAAA